MSKLLVLQASRAFLYVSTSSGLIAAEPSPELADRRFKVEVDSVGGVYFPLTSSQVLSKVRRDDVSPFHKP